MEWEQQSQLEQGSLPKVFVKDGSDSNEFLIIPDGPLSPIESTYVCEDSVYLMPLDCTLLELPLENQIEVQVIGIEMWKLTNLLPVKNCYIATNLYTTRSITNLDNNNDGVEFVERKTIPMYNTTYSFQHQYTTMVVGDNMQHFSQETRPFPPTTSNANSKDAQISQHKFSSCVHLATKPVQDDQIPVVDLTEDDDDAQTNEIPVIDLTSTNYDDEVFKHNQCKLDKNHSSCTLETHNKDKNPCTICESIKLKFKCDIPNCNICTKCSLCRYYKSQSN